jgi:hypothetical protein
MKLADKIHHRGAHGTGYNPACPVCVREGGLAGVIDHLRRCAAQNEVDATSDPAARFVAAEQRRVLAMLSSLARVDTVGEAKEFPRLRQTKHSRETLQKAYADLNQCYNENLAYTVKLQRESQELKKIVEQERVYRASIEESLCSCLRASEHLASGWSKQLLSVIDAAKEAV